MWMCLLCLCFYGFYVPFLQSTYLSNLIYLTSLCLVSIWPISCWWDVKLTRSELIFTANRYQYSFNGKIKNGFLCIYSLTIKYNSRIYIQVIICCIEAVLRYRMLCDSSGLHYTTFISSPWIWCRFLQKIQHRHECVRQQKYALNIMCELIWKFNLWMPLNPVTKVLWALLGVC